MKYIENLQQALPVFSALGSPIRIRIVELLAKNNEMGLNEIAKELSITPGTLTPHIKALKDAGVIGLRLATVPKGMKKMAFLAEDKIMIKLFDLSETQEEPCYKFELNVGQYSDFSVNAPCGLATYESFIGGVDSGIYFSYPERFLAELVWFTDGYITYHFPYLVNSNQKVKEIQITMEIASEAPGGSKDYPANVDVFINDHHLGKDFLPGERFERRGKLTPSWWMNNYGQYGWLKLYSINDEGTFFNGERVSNITLADLDLEKEKLIRFKVSCEDRENSPGGLTIFGKRFGDQEQGIRLKIIYCNNKQ